MKPYPVITSWPDQPGNFVILRSSLPVSVNELRSTVIRTFGDPFRTVILAGSGVRDELKKKLDERNNPLS